MEAELEPGTGLAWMAKGKVAWETGAKARFFLFLSLFLREIDERPEY